jgi:hypothetical protein
LIFIELIQLKKNMKKIILTTLVLFTMLAFLSSCYSSRKTGCPMTEKIIH